MDLLVVFVFYKSLKCNSFCVGRQFLCFRHVRINWSRNVAIFLLNKVGIIFLEDGFMLHVLIFWNVFN